MWGCDEEKNNYDKGLPITENTVKKSPDSNNPFIKCMKWTYTNDGTKNLCRPWQTSTVISPTTPNKKNVKH